MQTALPRRVVVTGGENGGDSGPVSIVGGDTWSMRVESVSESFELGRWTRELQSCAFSYAAMILAGWCQIRST